MSKDNDTNKSELASEEKKKNLRNLIREQLNAAKIMGPSHYKEAISRLKIEKSPGGEVFSAEELEKIAKEEEVKLKAEEQRKVVMEEIVTQDKREAVAQQQKIAQERKETEERQTAYKEFEAVHIEFKLRQEENVKNLKEALEVMKSGGELSEELKKKLATTPEETKKDKEIWEKTERANQLAVAHKKSVDDKIKKIDNTTVQGRNEINSLKLSTKADDEVIAKKADLELEKLTEAELLSNMEKYAKDKPEYMEMFKSRSDSFKELHRMGHKEVIEKEYSKLISSSPNMAKLKAPATLEEAKKTTITNSISRNKNKDGKSR